MRILELPVVETEVPIRGSRRRWLIGVAAITGAAAIALAALYLTDGRVRGLLNSLLNRAAHRPPNEALIRWFSDPASREALATSFDAPCPGYPFLVPSSGLVGGLPWNAAYGPYNALNPHPGIDIFGQGSPGTVPVYAAYDGFLTREADWRSAVIIRHDDPLHPGETIWTYYTHMADLNGDHSYIVERFPPGTYDVPVRQGDLLGYQGLYNGGPSAPRIGLHVHFSIVRSDRSGHYRNEAVFGNTLDPTPYLGLSLNDPEGSQYPLRCLPPPDAS